MGKRVDVTYNPQLGYLQTVFKNDFDFLASVKDYAVKGNKVVFNAETYKKNTATVELSFINDLTVHFCMYPLANTSCFRNQVFNFSNSKCFKIEEDSEFVYLKTSRVSVYVRKAPWEISYYLDGRLITKEQVLDTNVDNMCKNLPIGFTYDEKKQVAHVNETMYMYSDEAFYGFGEKFTDLNKRGQTIHCWQTDALSTNTEKSYKNHPFFMSSRGYAVLLNTYTRSQFDMGTVSNVAYNMETEDNYLDCVFMFNLDYRSLLKSYIELTGKIPLIPKWAFGLWMSKCSYRSQQEIYQVVQTAKENNVKIDVIHIDGWQLSADSGAWEWDRERFPDPEGMIQYLKENGIHLSLWIFPYIGENSKFFRLAAEKGYLVKNRDGEPVRFYSTATSTSKVGCFDFTNPDFIAWYRPRVEKVLSMGVGVVKTDFSEAVPEDAVYYDGSNGVQGHNKLTYLYAKTIYDIMKDVKQKTGERPMLWGRSGYAGSHTIPAAWAGDSSTHKNNHACILRGGLSASMSGIPFWGFDMGGFYNTDYKGYECVPTDEEYIRSFQFGFFAPLSRCHGKTPREPWNFGKQAQQIFNRFNTTKHKLLPYLYSTSYQAHYDSVPMLRSLAFEFENDRNTRNIDLEYMLGDSLLVAPVFDQDSFQLYLPEGAWVDFASGEIVEGNKWLSRSPALDEMPVYVKENSIVPMLTAIPDSVEAPCKDLDVIVHIGSEIDTVYYDDGVSSRFHALISDRTLKIETDMPIQKMRIYSKEKISRVKINGISADFNTISEGHIEVCTGSQR